MGITPVQVVPALPAPIHHLQAVVARPAAVVAAEAAAEVVAVCRDRPGRWKSNTLLWEETVFEYYT